MVSDRQIKKGFYCYCLLEAVFIALKLCGIVPFPWYVVLFPFWILPTLVLLFIAAFAIYVKTKL